MGLILVSMGRADMVQKHSRINAVPYLLSSLSFCISQTNIIFRSHEGFSVVTWYVLMWDVHNIGWCVSYELHVVCVGCGVWVLLCMCVLFCLTAYILQVIIKKKSFLFLWMTAVHC